MDSKYISYEEFAHDYPGISREYYDAILQKLFVVRLNNKDLYLCKNQTEIKSVIGSNKKYEVWHSSDLLRVARAVALKMYDDDDESPSVLVDCMLHHKEWFYETRKQFIIDTGATHTIVNVSAEEYDAIDIKETVIHAAAGAFPTKIVIGKLVIGKDTYHQEVRVSSACPFNLLGMDIIKQTCLTMIQGRISLCANNA